MRFLKDNFRRRCCAYFIILFFFVLQLVTFSSAGYAIESNLTGPGEYSVLVTLGSISESMALTAHSTRTANAQRLQLSVHVPTYFVLHCEHSLFADCFVDLFSRWDRDGSSPRPNSSMALLI